MNLIAKNPAVAWISVTRRRGDRVRDVTYTQGVVVVEILSRGVRVNSSCTNRKRRIKLFEGSRDVSIVYSSWN